jgi:hypothetical protein
MPLAPALEHYSCLVDLFARSGHLAKAVSVVLRSPSCGAPCALSRASLEPPPRMLSSRALASPAAADACRLQLNSSGELALDSGAGRAGAGISLRHNLLCDPAPRDRPRACPTCPLHALVGYRGSFL